MKEYIDIKEENEDSQDTVICEKCGNDTFRAYITIIVDDIRLYCDRCGEKVY